MSRYQTPSKANSLKTAIIDRVSTSKSKNYRSNASTKFQSLPPAQNDTTEDPDLMQKVLQKQSSKNEGFFEYANWVAFHKEFLSHVDEPVVLEMWKILRIINQGQVFIPTGLVYQIFKSALDPQSPSFESVLNYFLIQNQIPATLRSFKEINAYRSIQSIENIYRGVIEESKATGPRKSSLLSRNDSDRRLNSKGNENQENGNVFHRNFKEAERRSANKITAQVANLVQQHRKLSTVPSSQAVGHISKMSHIQTPIKRICHEKHMHAYKTEEEKFAESDKTDHILKAKKLDRSIFEGSIDGIPGVSGHVSRHQYCQAQKRRNERQKQRPCQTYAQIHSLRAQSPIKPANLSDCFELQN